MSVVPATCTALNWVLQSRHIFNVVVYLCLRYSTRKDARPSHSKPDPFFSYVHDIARVAYSISRPRWFVTRVGGNLGKGMHYLNKATTQAPTHRTIFALVKTVHFIHACHTVQWRESESMMSTRVTAEAENPVSPSLGLGSENADR